MDILLLFDYKNPDTAACSLFCVDVNLKLTYLRSRMLKEVRDFVPKEFVFIRSEGEENIFISKDKEEMLTIKSVTYEKDNNLSLLFAPVSPDDPLVTEKESEPQPHSASSQCIFSPSTRSNQNATLSLGLKSPTSWSIKGVKVYDEKEVDSAIGQEKKRRLFWKKSKVEKVELFQTEFDKLSRDVKELGRKVKKAKKRLKD